MTSKFKQLILVLVIYWTTAVVSAIKCYNCDNSLSSACGNAFKAYQFQATVCAHEASSDLYKCGKQEQPPDANGWVGVIRACYRLGQFKDMNETNGCHNHYDDAGNFTAIYCFCDTSYCNGAPARQHLFLVTPAALLLMALSALLSIV